MVEQLHDANMCNSVLELKILLEEGWCNWSLKLCHVCHRPKKAVIVIIMLEYLIMYNICDEIIANVIF